MHSTNTDIAVAHNGYYNKDRSDNVTQPFWKALFKGVLRITYFVRYSNVLTIYPRLVILDNKFHHMSTLLTGGQIKIQVHPDLMCVTVIEN